MPNRKKTWEKTHQNFPHVREMRFQSHNGANKVAPLIYFPLAISRDLFTDFHFSYRPKDQNMTIVTIVVPIDRLS